MELSNGLTGATPSSKRAGVSKDKRRFNRLPGEGRQLQLLINGSPTSFALQNISAGGVMGDSVAELAPGAQVSVCFEDGTVVPAIVKWADGGFVGLAFSPPSLL